jgi:hypothetical protein
MLVVVVEGAEAAAPHAIDIWYSAKIPAKTDIGGAAD